MSLPERRTENEFITYRAHPYYSMPDFIMQLRALAGYDVGHSIHPSHVAVLLPAERGSSQRFIQIASIWIPTGTPYVQQVQRIKTLMHELSIRQTIYDATRGELEALREQGLMNGFKPFTLTAESKKRLAGRLLTYLEQGKLTLLPDERQKRSLLQVDNMLRAEESVESHGDSFWSLALALSAVEEGYSCIPRLMRR